MKRRDVFWGLGIVGAVILVTALLSMPALSPGPGGLTKEERPTEPVVRVRLVPPEPDPQELEFGVLMLIIGLGTVMVIAVLVLLSDGFRRFLEKILGKIIV